MYNFTFSFLEEQIKKSREPLILTHVDPDGDAIGSVMAIKEIIETSGIKPNIYLTGKLSSGLKISEKTNLVSKANVGDFDLVIILDTNNLARTGIETVNSIPLNTPVFIIDHHIKKEGLDFPENFHVIIDPDATATCEIIFNLLKKEEKEISNATASYLLLGIYTDSGGFFHSNTTPALLKKVSELLKRGVLFKNITQAAFKGKKVGVVNFWGEKISESLFHPKLNFIFTWLSNKELKNKGVTTEEIGGLVNLLNMCDEAKFSLLLSETDEKKIKGSLRSSERKGVNVNIISRFLGGGGHRLAAGFEVAGKIVEKGKNLYVKRV